MDPWMLAFPFDDPQLAQRKYEFCRANKIRTHHLHDITRHKKYQFALRRMMKQEKRALALKQKLLLKFLSGDALQKAKDQMRKGPAEQELEAEQEKKKLRDREQMIAKLLAFWHRRMKMLEDEHEAEKEQFRFKVRALLEDIRSLAQVLEGAALAKKRRRRVDADDLLRLRQQKAEEAARHQVEEREKQANFQALMAARDGDADQITSLQQLAAAVRSGEEGEKAARKERKRLAELLQTFLKQRKPGSKDEPKSEARSDGTSSSSSSEAPPLRVTPANNFPPPMAPSLEVPPGVARRSSLQLRRLSTSPGRASPLGDVPVQTLNAANLELLAAMEAAPVPRRSHSLSSATGVLRAKSQRQKGTAKRKPSVAQRDSIFANPAAFSRRMTGDQNTAAIQALKQEESREPKGESSPDLEKDLPVRSGSGEHKVAVGSWTFGAPPAAGTAGAAGTSSKERSQMRGMLHPRSQSVASVVQDRRASRQQPSRPSVSGPSRPSVSGPSRPSVSGGVVSLHLPEGKGDSRRGSKELEEDRQDEDELRAQMFLKATYMHLGAFRQQTTHPALKSQRAALSDSILAPNGETLFRNLVAQIMDLPPIQHYKVVKHMTSAERGRCLFIVKNSLIHQARAELEAAQRVVHIMEAGPEEVLRQLAEGGPLFPAVQTAETSSSSEEEEEAETEKAPRQLVRRKSTNLELPDSDKPVPQDEDAAQRLRRRRAGMHGFLAFAGSLAQISPRKSSVAARTSGASPTEPEPVLLQIRSADTRGASTATTAATTATAESEHPKHRPGSKSGHRISSLSEGIKEAQADQDAARKANSEKTVGLTSSLASSMLKTMLKKPVAAKGQSTTMSLIGDYAWDKVLHKFESHLRKSGLELTSEEGQWKSHFAYDVPPEGPLSSRLKDRPLSAPSGSIRLQRKRPDRAAGSIMAPVPEAPTPAEPEEVSQEHRPTTKDAPLLFALAKFMYRMKNRKPRDDDWSFAVAEARQTYLRRPSKPRILTEEMEAEWRELRQKVIKQKGQWLQHSRMKVERMHQEDEGLAGEVRFDRQQRNLRERNPVEVTPFEGFDAVSFVRWKVNKQLKTAMEAAKEGKTGPVSRERSAGPPPPEPIWVVGDTKYDAGLEAAKQRIQGLRAKKYRGKPFLPGGEGRGWRLDLGLFEDMDYKVAHPDEAEDGQSESGLSSGTSSRSTSLTRFTPTPDLRKGRRKISKTRQVRDLSVLPPWMRRELMSDEDYVVNPGRSDWDMMCWLQPVRYGNRTATDRVITPERMGQALSRKGSRSNRPTPSPSEEDPVLLVQRACRALVEEYGDKQEEDDEKRDDARETKERPLSPEKHDKVLEILQKDSLLKEPLERVLEEDEEETGQLEDAPLPPNHE
ncbi:unnamed protein product [Effrenium voratum]|nr:unnamed protein product [Effrenium voratum]